MTKNPYQPPLPAWFSLFLGRATRVASIPQQPTTASALMASLDLRASALADQMLLAGWHRESVWSRAPDGKRVLTAWWSPAGLSAPRAPRGRPTVYLTIAEALQALPAPSNALVTSFQQKELP